MLRQLMLILAISISGLCLFVTPAEAKRLGGGRAVGIQRQVTPPQRQATPPQRQTNPAANPASATRPVPQTAPARSGFQRFLGPLAGIATAVGLAALLSHFGLGSDVAGMLLIVLVGVVAFMFLRRLFGAAVRPAQPAYEPAAYAGVPDEVGGAPQHVSAHNLPAGFDADVFARQAKLNFIRLQSANDACNLAEIREFTTPEVFSELKLEIDDRGGRTQRTDVVMLEAEVLEVVEEDRQYRATVRYFGKLREDDDAHPQAFDEIWHLTKPIDGNRGWVLAGIQQMAA